MSEPFIAEIRIFAGNFAPQGWACCDGQLLPIAQFAAVFSLVGTTYGGDGQSTFGLPNLKGRVPVHAGSGPGLPTVQLGQLSGAADVALTAAEMPAHAHGLIGSSQAAGSQGPKGGLVANGVAMYAPPANLGATHPDAITAAGGGQAHNNLQPYLAVTFIFALVGIFPSGA